MSFTEGFESYAKQRLRQIIAEMTVDGSARRLVDYSTMLFNIERKGVKAAMWIAPNEEEAQHEWREGWRYVVEGYFSEEYRPGRFSIRTVEGTFAIDGVIVRNTGLAYNQNQGNKKWYITHLNSGDNTGNTLKTEKDAQLYIQAMLEVAANGKFSWNWTMGQLQTAKVLNKETRTKIEAAFEALKQVDTKEAA